MKPRLCAFAAVALLPAMTGALPAGASARSVEVALCNGGSISIPLDSPSQPGGENAPCCAKGCHSSQSRKRLDRAQ